MYTHPKEPRVIYPSGKSVIVRNLEDPSDCFIYHGHNNPVTVAKFSPSGYWVASADDTGKVRVWSWDNTEHPLKVEVAAFSGRIIDLDWDPESKRIVVVGDGKQVSAKCFMWDTGNSVGEMIGHSKRISTVSYKPSRPFRIMTGGEDFKTCWYAGPPFKIDHTNADHTKEVWCARFSPDGSKLASVGADRKIVFYDSKEGAKVSEITEATEGAHTSSIVHCCWSPDSTKLATCSLDKTVKVWDATCGSLETTFTFGDEVTLADMQCCVAWFGPFLVSLNLARELHYLDFANPTAPARTVVAHSGPVTSLCASLPLGCGEFLTGGSDGLVLKWNGSGVAEKVLGPDKTTRTTHAGKVVGVFSGGSGGGGIASVGFDDKVRFSNQATLLASDEFALDGQPACACSSQGPGGLVAVATSASTLHFFRDGAALLSEPVKLPGVPLCLCLSADESEVVVGGVGNALLVFALDLSAQEGAQLTQVKSVEGHRGQVGCVAYSPDGTLLAAGDANREIKVWDRSTWETKVSGKWVFHTSAVTCLAWSPDGAHVSSGSFDQSVFVWCLASPMKKVQIKFAHKMGVTAVAYLDEQKLVTAGNDGTVVVWNV